MLGRIIGSKKLNRHQKKGREGKKKGGRKTGKTDSWRRP